MGEVKDSIESYRMAGIQESVHRLRVVKMNFYNPPLRIKSQNPEEKGIIILNPELSIPLLATAIRRVVWSNTSFYWRV